MTPPREVRENRGTSRMLRRLDLDRVPMIVIGSRCSLKNGKILTIKRLINYTSVDPKYVEKDLIYFSHRPTSWS